LFERGSNLTRFPVLISITDTDLRDRASSSGCDIVFRALDANICNPEFATDRCTLYHELEKYDSSTGTLVAWVQIPTLDYNDNTVIYMYYGNSSISDTFPCTNSTANPTGVWDTSYKGVWHLKEATGAQVNDSTTTPNNGSPQGSPPQTVGKIDGSLSFNSASNQYVQVTNSTDLQLSTNMTISAWVNTTSSDYQSRLIVAKWLSGGNRNYWFGKFWPGAATFSFCR
jgi:hypothetical protein